MKPPDIVSGCRTETCGGNLGVGTNMNMIFDEVTAFWDMLVSRITIACVAAAHALYLTLGTISAVVHAVAAGNVFGEGDGEACRARTVATGAGWVDLACLHPHHLTVEERGQRPRNGAHVESLSVVPLREHGIVAKHVAAREVAVHHVVFRFVLDGSVLVYVMESVVLIVSQEIA